MDEPLEVVDQSRLVGDEGGLVSVSQVDGALQRRHEGACVVGELGEPHGQRREGLLQHAQVEGIGPDERHELVERHRDVFEGDALQGSPAPEGLVEPFQGPLGGLARLAELEEVALAIEVLDVDDPPSVGRGQKISPIREGVEGGGDRFDSQRVARLCALRRGVSPKLVEHVVGAQVNLKTFLGGNE